MEKLSVLLLLLALPQDQPEKLPQLQASSQLRNLCELETRRVLSSEVRSLLMFLQLMFFLIALRAGLDSWLQGLTACARLPNHCSQLQGQRLKMRTAGCLLLVDFFAGHLTWRSAEQCLLWGLANRVSPLRACLAQLPACCLPAGELQLRAEQEGVRQ